MGTKIVLKQDVDKLGEAGELVEVAPGYARNYLIPQGLAVKATPGIIAEAEKRLARKREIAAQKRAEAFELKQKLEQFGVYELTAPVGEDGQQLFGTITTGDVAEALLRYTGVTVDRREVTIDEPIRTTGAYAARVRLFQDVSATIRLQVNPEG